MQFMMKRLGVLAFTAFMFVTIGVMLIASADLAYACGGPCPEPEPEPEPEPKPEPEPETPTPPPSDRGSPILKGICEPYAAQFKRIVGSEGELGSAFTKAIANHKWQLVWVKSEKVIGLKYVNQPAPFGATVWKMTALPSDGRVCVKPHFS